jgi:hypothetical protein
VNLLTEHAISCPYCGERITLLIDASINEQEYIEDCQVCCRPIVLNTMTSSDGTTTAGVRREDD